MSGFLKQRFDTNKLAAQPQSSQKDTRPLTAVEWLRAKSEHPGMRLIPWADIWTSLHVARIHGNGEMIEVFYDTLFKEAVFDDRGAWALDTRKNN